MIQLTDTARESRVSIFFLDPGEGISRLTRIETSDLPITGPTVSRIFNLHAEEYQ